MDIFIQVLGFIAVGFNIISVQFNTHTKIMIFKTVGTLLFVIHYLLLGAYVGMVLDSIGIIRNVIFAERVYRKKKNFSFIIFFSIITLIAGCVTICLSWNESVSAMSRWTDNQTVMVILTVFISLISIIAKTITTIAYGLKSPHMIRMLNLPSSACWLIYNTLSFSLSGLVNEAIVICSISIAEYRFRKLPNGSTGKSLEDSANVDIATETAFTKDAVKTANNERRDTETTLIKKNKTV